MAEISADKEQKHGFHTDKYYPGLIRSSWRVGPVRITRERKYSDRTNQQMKSEGWILSLLPVDTQRFGLKWERDCK